MEPSIVDTIATLEQRLRQAMLTSNTAELDALLSCGLVFTTHLGAVLSKQEDLEMHSSGALKIEDIRMADPRILPCGEVAIVTVQAEIVGAYKGLPSSGTFRFTRVWRRSPGSGWQVVVGHACAVV